VVVVVWVERRQPVAQQLAVVGLPGHLLMATPVQQTPAAAAAAARVAAAAADIFAA
jgi:hypothetical protein